MIKPQKAKHLYLEAEKVNPHYVGKSYMAFEKHDGWYGFMDPDDTIRSRQLRAIPSVEWLSEILVGLEGRLIFEIMVDGMPVFKDLNGYLNRKSPGPNAYILVHDYLLPGDLPFNQRHVAAKLYVAALRHPKVRLANLLSNSCTEEVWQPLAEAQWALGREGIVLKERYSKYEAGRRIGSLLKIKEDFDADCIVIGLQEGTGKYVGMLGALLVEDEDGYTHTVSGMSDAERSLWWLDPSLILGCTVEIKAMKRLANGSLREPRFKSVRFDK